MTSGDLMILRKTEAILHLSPERFLGLTSLPIRSASLAARFSSSLTKAAEGKEEAALDFGGIGPSESTTSRAFLRASPRSSMDSESTVSRKALSEYIGR